MIFPKLLAIMLYYRNHFPHYPINNLRMDNAQEFRSHAFEDYCTATGISLTYSVPYEHSQNGLGEVFIKKIQLVARPLFLHANLPSFLWGHVVLHATALLRLRPTLLNVHTPMNSSLDVHQTYPTSASLDIRSGCLFLIPKDIL